MGVYIGRDFGLRFEKVRMGELQPSDGAGSFLAGMGMYNADVEISRCPCFWLVRDVSYLFPFIGRKLKTVTNLRGPRT